jgi:PKD repeat protein
MFCERERRGVLGKPSGFGDRRLRSPRGRLVAVLLAVAGMLVAGLPQTSAGTSSTGSDQIGEWGPILNWPTQGKHLILMPTGKVLVFPVGDKTYVWNPATGEFKFVPATFGDIHCAGHVTLADGDPLVVGGVNVDPFVGIKLNARFDAATETWTVLTPMKYARWYPTVTTLGDGRVLAISGTDEAKAKSAIPEVYDPATDTWTQLTGASRTQPLYPFMYVAPDGRVLDAAPKGANQYLNVAGSGSWSSGPTRPWDNQSGGCCNESGGMYGKGKILQSGGGDPAHARTGILDLTASTPAWEEVEPMAFPRRRHNVVVLADGSTLAVGGTRASDDASRAVLEAERFDPATKQWDTMAAMAVPRMYHSSAILLPDGSVVAAGGDNPSSTAKLTAQIYRPPYFFKGARPAITASPASASYGGTLTVGTDTAGIAEVALIRPGAATHAIDMNQRYVPLSFTQSGGDLTVAAPANGNVAPPGAYMLVVENANGVPSVARWIVLGAGAPPPPAAPTADFVASPTSGAAPLAVSFANQATGTGPLTFAWDFENDGTVDATDPNPQHTYTSMGKYTVRLTVTNAEGSDEQVKTDYITVGETPPPSSGQTWTFSAEADARVQESSPSTNYGTSFLRADGGNDPDVESYLRFTVSGVDSVTSAKLRVHATSGTGNGPAVHTAADNGWSEAGLTWGNRPARTSTGVDDKASIAADSWIEFDVTSLVAGSGTYTFVLATNSSDGVNLSSREATTSANRPHLVVTAGEAAPGPPTAEFTASPLRGYAPLTVDFADLSKGADAWAWDFQNDDGFESTERNPTFTYTNPGTYTVRLQVENEHGGDEEIKVEYVTVDATPATLTFSATADAKIKSSSATKNYGTVTDLQVRLGNSTTPHTYRSYVKFAVSGLARAPRSAKLRLYVVDPSAVGGLVHAVSSSWTESGITWNNAPLIEGSPLATIGPVSLNTWAEIDVGSVVTGNGTYSFALKEGTSSDSAHYASRETATRPELVVTP